MVGVTALRGPLIYQSSLKLEQISKISGKVFCLKIWLKIEPEILAQKFSFGICEPAKLGAANAARNFKKYTKNLEEFL